ncbi:MAG TPA: MltA domain-containing protein [Caulobacteraceae bacterium]|nr:MltA domain-containing protein [Caulobacteraceae bacterium]
MRLRIAAGAALLLLLAACATPREPVPGPGPTPPPPPRPAAGISPAALPGWDREDHAGALAAFQAGCGAARDEAGRALCREARALAGADAATARRFFETRFRAVALEGTGLLTAYFAPEYEARTAPDEIFSMPVKPRPTELQRGPDGKYPAWKTRAEIETEDGPALAWMRAEDLFFMQIQGSGYLTFPDGRRARAAYAADNGQPFVGIARPMAEQGLLPPNGTSGDAIRAWLAAHRGPEAQAITDLNPRYIFFALEADDGGQPRGAANIPLPEGRAIAVDPSHHAYGAAYWIEGDGGNLIGATRSYRRLVMALDTGGAIRGPVRADLYLGRGEAAGTEAGRVRHPLRMWRLMPAR